MFSDVNISLDTKSEQKLFLFLNSLFSTAFHSDAGGFGNKKLRKLCKSQFDVWCNKKSRPKLVSNKNHMGDDGSTNSNFPLLLTSN